MKNKKQQYGCKQYKNLLEMWKNKIASQIKTD